MSELDMYVCYFSRLYGRLANFDNVFSTIPYGEADRLGQEAQWLNGDTPGCNTAAPGSNLAPPHGKLLQFPGRLPPGMASTVV